jgi:hypothetical protein
LQARHVEGQGDPGPPILTREVDKASGDMARRRRAIEVVIIVLGVACFAVPASGQPLAPPELPSANVAAAPDRGTLADSIVRDPLCRERTNGCELCARTETGGVGCSTPGIACQPEHWRCVPEDKRRGAARQ